jgi:hypothetical protein
MKGESMEAIRNLVLLLVASGFSEDDIRKSVRLRSEEKGIKVSKEKVDELISEANEEVRKSRNISKEEERAKAKVRLDIMMKIAVGKGDLEKALTIQKELNRLNGLVIRRPKRRTGYQGPKLLDG